MKREGNLKSQEASRITFHEPPEHLCTAISRFARRRRRFNAEAQRFAEIRREFFFSAFLCTLAPLRWLKLVFQGHRHARALPAIQPVVQAAWKLKPPVRPKRGSNRMSYFRRLLSAELWHFLVAGGGVGRRPRSSRHQWRSSFFVVSLAFS